MPSTCSFNKKLMPLLPGRRAAVTSVVRLNIGAATAPASSQVMARVRLVLDLLVVVVVATPVLGTRGPRTPTTVLVKEILGRRRRVPPRKWSTVARSSGVIAASATLPRTTRRPTRVVRKRTEPKPTLPSLKILLPGSLLKILPLGSPLLSLHLL